MGTGIDEFVSDNVERKGEFALLAELPSESVGISLLNLEVEYVGEVPNLATFVFGDEGESDFIYIADTLPNEFERQKFERRKAIGEMEFALIPQDWRQKFFFLLDTHLGSNEQMQLLGLSAEERKIRRNLIVMLQPVLKSRVWERMAGRKNVSACSIDVSPILEVFDKYVLKQSCGAVDAATLGCAFEDFGAGILRRLINVDIGYPTNPGILTEPDGGNIFLFAELAFAAREQGAPLSEVWVDMIMSLVRMQAFFVYRFPKTFGNLSAYDDFRPPPLNISAIRFVDGKLRDRGNLSPDEHMTLNLKWATSETGLFR